MSIAASDLLIVSLSVWLQAMDIKFRKSFKAYPCSCYNALSLVPCALIFI